MAETQEQKDKKDEAKHTGKFVWFILIIITVIVGFLSLWYFSQYLIDDGIDSFSNIGGSVIGEFSSWS